MKWTDACNKAITFSFDDGVVEDVRMVELLNKYGLKATFNINSGLCGYKNASHGSKRLPMDELVELYEGHEVSIHTKTHPPLTELTLDVLEDEINSDKKALEKHFGYKVVGMAYPFGEYNDDVVSILKKHGVLYARTVDSSYDFELQTDLLKYKPTSHILDPKVSDLVYTFLNDKQGGPKVLYLWGHSYEFQNETMWKSLKELFKKLSNHSDVFYGTNRDVLI